MGCSSGKQAVQEISGNAYLDAETVKVVNQAFDEIDKSGDKKLSFEEALPGLKKCGFEISSDTLESLIKLVDDNNDGKLSKDEFMRCIICLTIAETKDPAPYILFVAADRDMSKKISKDEFKKACKKLDLDKLPKFDEVAAGIKEELDINEYLEKLVELKETPAE